MQQKGLGWLLYAWIILLTAGIMSIIDGILALSRGEFFENVGAMYVASDLKTWGWIVLVVGILEIVAAGSVWKGGRFGRWFGIFIAAVSLIMWLFWVPIYPVWAMIASFMAILVIYGLAVYGRQTSDD